MIIVEGPDGAGKSTLVQELCREFNLHEGIRGTKNRDLLYTVTVPDTMRALACAVQGHRQPYVWDRLYFSDFAYAPAQGRDVEFNQGQQDHIETMMGAIGHPLIFCMPPVETVIANAMKTHQMEGVKDNLGKIYEAYDRMVVQYEYLNPFIYDYTVMGVDEPLRYVAAYLRDRKDREL